VLALVPAPASAVTVKEIVSLTKAGVSEPVILALIERDKTIFTITPEQLITLQKEGLTDAVLLAMLRSGRQELPVQEQGYLVQQEVFSARIRGHSHWMRKLKERLCLRKAL